MANLKDLTEKVQQNVHHLLDQRWACSCGREHIIPTKQVLIYSHALERLPSFLTSLFPEKRRILLVADETTEEIAGIQIERRLTEAGYGVQKILLRASGPEEAPEADRGNVDHVVRHISDHVEFLLSVGSGTVNDVTKRAAHERSKPYVVCPTASSMNGYTSPIAAIMEGGTKVTVPAHPPLGVLADMDLLAKAPIAMTRAGLADLLSKSVSTADWRLSSLIEDTYYCERPNEIVSEAERLCAEQADAIGRGAPEAIEPLIHALLLSGFSMVVAGSSSPASGGEHLISHYWDMTAAAHGRHKGLHGAQVGVTTLITSKLYEKLRTIDPGRVYTEALPDPQARSRVRKIQENWETLWEEVGRILRPWSAIRPLLVRAGAPVTVSELGIPPDELREAFLRAKDIRQRYTVLHFAHDLGVLQDLAEEVLSESGVLRA